MWNLTSFLMESSLHLEIVLILTQDRCTVWMHHINSYVTWVMWNLTSFHLGTVLVLVQDRCMVCARRTIGSEIILDALDGTTR